MATAVQLMRETQIPFSKARTVLSVTKRTLSTYRRIGLTVYFPPKGCEKKARKNWPRVRLECRRGVREWHTTAEAWERFWSRVNGEQA